MGFNSGFKGLNYSHFLGDSFTNYGRILDFIRRIVRYCVCYDVSEERTPSIFWVTERVQVDVEITGLEKYMFSMNCHVFPPSLQHPPEQIQPENWGSIFLRNPSNYIPIYTASCLRRLELSTLLRAPQASYRHATLQGVQFKSGPSTKPWIFHVRCYL